MEEINAFGVSCIEFVQYWFKDQAWYFELVNNVSNPYYALELLFPIVSIVDSVFAAQLLLCLGFGVWLNCCMKWWLMEDRPYWWIAETKYYEDYKPPVIEQNVHTCETGPGSPSGHSMLVAMQIMLFVMWIAHVCNDRGTKCLWWKGLLYPVLTGALCSVIMARMFAAAHFPHQCLLGAFIGLFLSPFLCIYVSDPYIWSAAGGGSRTRTLLVHVAMSLAAILVAFTTYWWMKWYGMDPQWSVKLAFKWCRNPRNIHHTTTPMYALVQCCANLLAYSFSVGPHLNKYRHYTKQRSVIISAIATYVVAYTTRQFQENVNKDDAIFYYIMQFLIYTIKPILFLNVTPWLAALPFQVTKSKKE